MRLWSLFELSRTDIDRRQCGQKFGGTSVGLAALVYVQPSLPPKPPGGWLDTQTRARSSLFAAPFLFRARRSVVAQLRRHDRLPFPVRPHVHPTPAPTALAAFDLPHGIGDDTSFFVEGPAGQRIEQHDIDLMRFIPPDKAA